MSVIHQLATADLGTPSYTSLSMYQIWHSRLGHPNHEVLKSVLKLCNQHFPNKSSFDFCSACCLGKSHRLPSVSSTTSYNKPLELVFCGDPHMLNLMEFTPIFLLALMRILDTHGSFLLN